MPTDLYDTLGVPKDADQAAIKKAYRGKAKKAHPDGGGSEAAFNEVALAYRVLSDDEKRGRYDRTGKVDDEPDNTLSMVMQAINGKIDELLQMPDVHLMPLIEICTGSIESDLRRVRQELKKADEVMLRLAKTRRRLKFKGKGANLLDSSMDVRQKQVEQAMGGMRQRIDILERAIAMLADYEFEVEKPPSPTMRPTGGIFWTNGGAR